MLVQTGQLEIWMDRLKQYLSRRRVVRYTTGQSGLMEADRVEELEDLMVEALAVVVAMDNPFIDINTPSCPYCSAVESWGMDHSDNCLWRRVQEFFA